MRLNGLQIADQGGPQVLKAWIMHMNMALKEKPLQLKVDNCSLPARVRMGSSKVSSQSQWAFDGGEDLVLQSVFQEPNIHRDTTVLKATFAPAPSNLKLLSQGFANMTLEMESAFLHFEGLEAWVAQSQSAMPAVLAKKQSTQTFAPAVKREELQASDEWGAW